MKTTRFIDKTLLLETGHEYVLEIMRTIRIPGEGKFYIGRDLNGLKHLIPALYYRNYGIREGDTVKCHLDRINCLGRFYFEPCHPVYERGKTYPFKLQNFIIDDESGETLICRARVIDIYGGQLITLEFMVRQSLPANLISLLCTVVSLKKGRLLLRVNDKRLALITRDSDSV